MAGKGKRDRVAALIAGVEALAKRLRADIRKRLRAAGLLKNIQTTADRLRKRATAAAAQVEKYVHEIRRELEGGVKPAKPVRPKKRRRIAAAPVAKQPPVLP